MVRYLKIISTVFLWVIIFTVTLSKTYPSDSGLGLDILNFFDSLSFKDKGFDVGIKSVIIGETFDDNILLSKEEKEDFITEVGGSFGVNYEGKTMSLGLTGIIRNQTFAKNNEFNNVAQDILLNFKMDFSDYDRISLSNVFTHSEAPLQFREDFVSEQFGRTGGRFDYFKNRFNINYAKDITKQFAVNVRYDNYLDLFSGVDFTGSIINKPGFAIDYLLTSSTSISFSYDLTYAQFENERDASVNTIATGIKQYITKKLFFYGSTGLDFIDSFDEENFTKPLFVASLTYEKDANTRAGLSFEKKYKVYPYTDEFFNTWTTSASATRQLSKRARCTLSLFYGEGEYIESDLEQKLRGAKADFKYDLYKNLQGNLIYTYSNAEYSVKSLDYDKNTLFLGFLAAF